MSFIDHHTLLSIKDLSLAARKTIDGFMTGINKSKVKGPGLEFSQYRSYQPGDDLRWLDWKRYARSDRFYIRESEVETSISVRLMVDVSNSMNHRDGAFSKLDYARLLAASLGWLAHMQGDSFGLYLVGNGGVRTLPARKDPQHLARFFYQLETLVAGGTLGAATQHQHILAGESKRELFVVITDMYERDGEVFSLLEWLASMRHEVIVFHVMGRNELEMDFSGYQQVQDLESGEKIAVSDATGYRDRLQAWLEQTRMRLLDKHIDYRLMRLDEPVDEALRKYLQQRQKITG